ncbi:MAG: DUF899 family protein [Phycisphaeraceae bacterium]|nr:DUF899 family protein [Phycisphaeraceae bacterium]
MNDEVRRIESEINALRRQLVEARKAAAAMPVRDYVLRSVDGAEVRLSGLFGNKPDLILVHNMGRKCPYCTLWADGFVGFARHIGNRAGFALCSADEPEVAREFAASRGWPYRVVSGHGSSFAHDMGFEPKPGEPWPGVSTFRRAGDGSITRIGAASFGPGDEFCSIWHMLDLLRDGAAGWEPKYSY